MEGIEHVATLRRRLEISQPAVQRRRPAFGDFWDLKKLLQIKDQHLGMEVRISGDLKKSRYKLQGIIFSKTQVIHSRFATLNRPHRNDF